MAREGYLRRTKIERGFRTGANGDRLQEPLWLFQLKQRLFLAACAVTLLLLSLSTLLSLLYPPVTYAAAVYSAVADAGTGGRGVNLREGVRVFQVRRERVRGSVRGSVSVSGGGREGRRQARGPARGREGRASARSGSLAPKHAAPVCIGWHRRLRGTGDCESALTRPQSACRPSFSPRRPPSFSARPASECAWCAGTPAACGTCSGCRVLRPRC